MCRKTTFTEDEGKQPIAAAASNEATHEKMTREIVEVEYVYCKRFPNTRNVFNIIIQISNTSISDIKCKHFINKLFNECIAHNVGIQTCM